MSITACETCDKWIDEDYDVEHFELCKIETNEMRDTKTEIIQMIRDNSKVHGWGEVGEEIIAYIGLKK